MTSLPIEDYHVGIICALASEMAAVEAMLDEEHETINLQDTQDHNAYTVGRIHTHNVVVACLPAGVDGLAAAANVAKDMSRTFNQLRFGLMVGIGGGIPNLEQGIDIRLGDIVVSEPTGTTGGVVQYDKGKSKIGGEWKRKGILNAPPVTLLTALQRLKARHLRHDSVVPTLMANMLQRYPKMVKTGYAFPEQAEDCLRRVLQRQTDAEAIPGAAIDDEIVLRPSRETHDPEIHYGIIASGNQVIKDADARDRIRRDCNALCVEMEAAGLMNEFPCLVIRGICDYADAYKNDQWHRYAAAVAAAFAKELLSYVSAEQANHEKPVQQVLGFLNEHFQQVHTHHSRHEAHLQKQEERYQSDRERDCHRTFKTSTYEEYKNRNPDRAPDTCQWLLKHEKYLRWQANHQCDLLWISADPGCGKSVLSKSLIDQDLHSEGSDQHSHVCYFFFKDNDAQDGLATALCAVLHQLFDGQPKLIRHALPAWEKNGNTIVYEIDELWRILLTAMADQEARLVVCVLDALDECRDVDRGRLIARLCQFYDETARVSSANTKLKFLVTSRPYDDIEYHFGNIAADLPSIRLRGEDQNDQIHAEIDSVVRQHVSKIIRDFSLAPSTAERLEQKLLKMEHRTYLWLYLAIGNIREAFSQSLRPDEEAIELLPASVEEAYEQILGKVSARKTRTVRAILQLILGARRPLAIGEMALALDIGTLKTVPQSFSDLTVREDQLVLKIRHWCGLFVFINHDRLYLIHQTAKEFLLRDSKQAWIDCGKWKHCLSATDIEYMMARVYISYLCLKEFDAPKLAIAGSAWHFESSGTMKQNDVHNDHVMQQPDHTQALFQLASESWTDHWRSLESVGERAMKDKVWVLYDMRSHCFLRWTRAMWRFKEESLSKSAMNNLILAAYIGHVGIVQRILDDGFQDLEVKDQLNCTALMRAAEMGHDNVVKSLLDAGADFNASGRHYGSVLQAAAFGGHEEVVHLLLGAGADVNAQGGRSGNALQAASCGGYEEVVCILVGAGAEVDAQGGEYGNALQAASRNGYEKVVQILVDAGADVNAPGGEYDNALQAASIGGHEEVVHLLLGAGADIYAKGGECGNALQAASLGGHETVVQILLGAGVDVNTEGGYWGNALQAASFKGHERVVQILLDAGADVNTPGGEYHNALHEASFGGHARVVQILLGAGADVNAQGGECGNALLAASIGGHEKVVQILLDTGVDIYAQGRGEKGRVLWAASFAGHEKVVQILLGAGVDVNTQGGLSGNALQAASSRGHKKVIQILLDAGAEVNAPGGESGNALQAASSGGHEEVVHLLLDAGADVNAPGGEYHNALHEASFGGHERVVQILLDAGADVNAQGGEFSNALQAASFKDHERVVQILLGAGADVNAQGGEFGNALQAASFKGHERVIQILLGAGANVNAQGGAHGSAINAALRGKHKQIVQILYEYGATNEAL